MSNRVNEESMYEMAKRVVGACLIDAKEMLRTAGFTEEMLDNNPNAVVMLALKLAEAKGGEEFLNDPFNGELNEA